MELITDASLVTQLKQGDMTAFDTLYTRYCHDVYRTAYLITGSRADSEDLTQEAFIQCLHSLHSLRDGSRFRPWLLKLLTRNAWKTCKKHGREQPAETLPQTGQAESALTAVLRQEEYHKLYTTLYTLSEKQRTCVVLYYFNDLSVHEIAKITGTIDATVKSRLFAARRILRQQLGGTLKEEFLHEYQSI